MTRDVLEIEGATVHSSGRWGNYRQAVQIQRPGVSNFADVSLFFQEALIVCN